MKEEVKWISAEEELILFANDAKKTFDKFMELPYIGNEKLELTLTANPREHYIVLTIGLRDTDFIKSRLFEFTGTYVRPDGTRINEDYMYGVMRDLIYDLIYRILDMDIKRKEIVENEEGEPISATPIQ